MKGLTAVIIDTVSIQRYIFSSNKLKENLGASHIVKNIFLKDIQNTLTEIIPEYEKMSFHEWENAEFFKDVSLFQNNDKVDVGYVGGGNALLFFTGHETALLFMKAFSKKILLNKPGVTLGMAYRKDLATEEITGDFTAFMAQMHEALQESKNSFFPNVTIQKFGITKDCPSSNEAADAWDWDKESKGNRIPISSVSKAKRDAAKSAQLSSKRTDETFNFHLTQEIDQLGQKEGDNWVAVVHIDGNNMGIKFRACNTLNKLRFLSKTVRNTTEKTFNELRQELDNNLQEHKEAVKKILNLKDVLPLRPIVIGGDDVTFVCNANLALYLTETFIKKWVHNMNTNEGLEIAGKNEQEPIKPFSACGGIVYVKTKYPFYQSYAMAETLCSRAKKLVKKHMDPKERKEYSALDFYIHQSSVSGNSDELVESQLHFGPYFIGESGEGQNLNNINDLLKGINFFENGTEESKKWPRSKRKALRDALNISPTSAKKLMGELNARGLKLPHSNEAFIRVDENEHSDLKTPYMDIIEVMEFYPEVFREWRDEDAK